MALKVIEVNAEFLAQMYVHREPDKSLGLIGACSKSVVIFSEKMIGLSLYAWQIYWLVRIQEAINNRMYNKAGYLINEFIALTSRQIGKSTVIALLALWCCVFNKVPGTISNNTIFGITSASDVQAKKLLQEMKKLLRIGDKYMENTYVDNEGKPLFGEGFFENLLDETEANNTTTITFKPQTKSIHGEYLLNGSLAGSIIKSYPPTSVVLGETFTVVVVDEAGKTDKISDQFHDEYIYPTGNSTRALRLYTSTPWVPSGFFYEMVNPDGTGPKHHADIVVFTIDAIKLENPEYYETVMKKIHQMQAAGKHDEVQRAYYCRFVKGEKSFFDPEKVFNIFSEKIPKMEGYVKSCDLGLDFGGQTTSRTVITISTMDDQNRIRRLYVKTYEVGQDNSIIEDIEELTKRFKIERMIPDECPQGDYIIREMVDKGWNVHPMNFRSEKVKKYGAFRSTLNRGEIESFEDDELKIEMLALEFAEGKRQSVIQHAPGYTDDLVDSFVLSCYFYVQDSPGIQTYDFEGLDTYTHKIGCPQCGTFKPRVDGKCGVCKFAFSNVSV